jgi:hypothetical protein
MLHDPCFQFRVGIRYLEGLRAQENLETLEMDGTHQLLVYDNENLLDRN